MKICLIKTRNKKNGYSRIFNFFFSKCSLKYALSSYASGFLPIYIQFFSTALWKLGIFASHRVARNSMILVILQLNEHTQIYNFTIKTILEHYKHQIIILHLMAPILCARGGAKTKHWKRLTFSYNTLFFFYNFTHSRQAD